MRYAAILALTVLAMCTVPAWADVSLEYLGATDQGDGTWLHEYVGQRDMGDTTNIRDLHLDGQFEWEQGSITLVSPNDAWQTMVYNGPGQILYNWQVKEGEAGWGVGNLEGFGIVVTQPYVTSTPFAWTDNQLPLTEDDLPDLGNVVGSGMTSVPVPEPGSMVVLGLGGLALVRRRRRSA